MGLPFLIADIQDVPYMVCHLIASLSSTWYQIKHVHVSPSLCQSSVTAWLSNQAEAEKGKDICLLGRGPGAQSEWSFGDEHPAVLRGCSQFCAQESVLVVTEIEIPLAGEIA